MMAKILKKVYIALIILFLYAPILVLVVLSFNKSKSRAVWGGFTLTGIFPFSETAIL